MYLTIFKPSSTSLKILFFSDTINVDIYGNAKIESESIWGMLRGLESFSQMIYSDGNNVSLIPPRATKNS